MPSISHDRNEESLAAKAKWFQTLSLQDRMDYLCEMVDLAAENNPKILEGKHVEPVAGRIRIITLPRG